jgi:hypothetical protein
MNAAHGDTHEKAESSDSSSSEDKVVTVNGKVHSYEDLMFYELMSKVEIELNRHQDQLNLDGADLVDQMAYWDEQLAYHDNYNVNLSKMIELYSMFLLASEKGLKVDDSAVEKTTKEFMEKTEQYEPAKKLVQSFDQEAYTSRLNRYFTQKLLAEQIYNLLKEDVLKEKSGVSEKEVAYEASKKYEELYHSQISSENIEIHTK